MRGRLTWIARRCTWREADGERGAVMILAAFGVAVAVACAALAIDTGRIASAARDHQKVADLAALDAVRILHDSGVTEADVLDRAQASALANGFDPTAVGHSLTIEVGNYDPQDQTWTVSAIADASAVRVEVTAPVDYSFIGGSSSPTRVGIAAQRGEGGFGIGSGLVSIDTDQSVILNGVLNALLPGPSTFSIGVLTYQGLATSDIELYALQQALLDEGVAVGTFDELMTADIEAVDFLEASATVLDNEGKTAEATALRSMKTTITGSSTFQMGDMVHVESGAEDSALLADFNVLRMVTGSAILANGTSAVSVPNLGIAIPGVASTNMSVSLVEAPQWYFGPVGGWVSTGQADIDLTTTLNLTLGIPGLTNGRVEGVIPVSVDAASATGTLAAVDCDPGSESETVDVLADPVTAQITNATLTVYAKVLFVTIPILNMDVWALSQTGSPVAGSATFDYPDDFDVFTRVVSNSLDLSSLLTLQGGNPVVLGALPIPVATIMNGVVAALGPVLGNISNKILNPAFEALGLNLGSADVAARGALDSDACQGPQLVG